MKLGSSVFRIACVVALLAAMWGSASATESGTVARRGG